MSYDFSQLSSLDFEELVKDLLQADWGGRLENFKPGRDGGIDIRAVHTGGNKTIVQCKHYIRSGFSNLASKLKTEELAKVQKLNPERYVLVTSLPLSAAEKDKIIEICAPYIKNSNDVIGQEELNSLLRKHSDIEKSHYKLWLSSTAVLERVLHNAVHVKSEQLVEEVRKKIPLYVQNSSYPDALNVLNQYRYVIISGEPGVGKTTLADMLLYRYIEAGYKPIKVENPKEAYDMYSPEDKIIYYYDDFLGITYYGDQLGHNTVSSLIGLVELVRSSKNARMLLTTREYILVRASQKNERLGNSELTQAKYCIKLSDYTRSIRARILYNHLYFSELDNKFLEEIEKQAAYKKIIDHPNYTPRIIEWMTKEHFLEGTQPENYPSFFIKTLTNPERLWEQPYLEQISDASRHLLLSLLSLGSKAEIKRLQKSFMPFHERACKSQNIAWKPTDYNYALKELLGSFINIDGNIVSFFNPSIKDFLETHVPKIVPACNDILESAVYMQQISILWMLSQVGSITHQEFLSNCEQSLLSAIEKLHKNPTHLFVKSAEGTACYYDDIAFTSRINLYLRIYARIENTCLVNAIYGTVDLVEGSKDLWGDDAIQHWTEVIININQSDLGINAKNDLTTRIKNFVLSNLGNSYIEDIFSLAEVREHNIFSEDEVSQISTFFSDYLENKAYQEYSQIDSSSGLEDYLDSLKEIAETFQTDITKQENDLLGLTEEKGNYESEYADHQQDMWKEQYYAGKDEDRYIESMFSNLSDR